MSLLNWFCQEWNPSGSYGRLGLEITERMEQQSGYIVNRIGYEAPQKALIPTIGGILTGWPTGFRFFGNLAEYGRRIALTMFESTKLPSDWAEPLNGCDEIILPSPWLVDVFREAGVTKPLHVIPLGVSREFTYVPRHRRSTFRILAIGDRGDRKGSKLAQFAFVKAFGDDPRVELIIKSVGERPTNLRFSNPNFRWLYGAYDLAQLAELYQSVDLFVFPSCGEGFGLPAREAAATGALSIATAWGGTADHLSEWGIPLGYTMQEAWRGSTDMDGKGLGEWAMPDVDQLAELMKWARALSIRSRNSIGRDAAERVKALYSWDQCTRSILDVWEGNADGNRTAA